MLFVFVCEYCHGAKSEQTPLRLNCHILWYQLRNIKIEHTFNETNTLLTYNFTKTKRLLKNASRNVKADLVKNGWLWNILNKLTAILTISFSLKDS